MHEKTLYTQHHHQVSLSSSSTFMADSIHVAMYPWFAMGHLTSFLHLANKLAQRGVRISFFLPPKPEPKLRPFNLHPDRIAFIPIVYPRVEGLPPGAQTTSDVSFAQSSLVVTAMDRTRDEIEAKLAELRPHFVFFDFSHWMPQVARRLSIKSVHFCTMNPASVAYLLVPTREEQNQDPGSETCLLLQQPPGFPPSTIRLKKYEAAFMHFLEHLEFGVGVTFHERNMRSLKDCDAISFKASREMEGAFCDYVESQFKKTVLLTGPGVPTQPTDTLQPQWRDFLDKHSPKSVVYVSFGSECKLKLPQFQELLLGLESTGYPFLVGLKPPEGAESVSEALPEGFRERVPEEFGAVHGGWMQQQLILGHPSVGCFVTHCGSGSLSEALVSECQIVLVPNAGDQFVNARLMGGDLKVGVEVEKREEDGWYSKESVCEAVKRVMEEESEVGKEVRENHGKWREFLLKDGLDSGYIDSFIKNLDGIIA